MSAVISLLATLLPMLYGLAAVNYQVYFVRRDPFAERTVTPFLLGTFALDVVYLGLRSIYFGRQPFTNVAEAIGLMALAMAGVYLYLERVQRNKFTGAFIIPFVVLLQLVSSGLMPEAPGPVPELLRQPLFGLHALVAGLGYTAFFLSAIYGFMYLLLYRALKQKKFGLIFERLPSLDVLASMSFWALFIGWIVLTLAIGLGVTMSVGRVPDFYLDFKTIGTLCVWGVYGAGVAAYFGLRWRGARAVYLSLFGFVFAVAALICSNFLLNTFHAFQS